MFILNGPLKEISGDVETSYLGWRILVYFAPLPDEYFIL